MTDTVLLNPLEGVQVRTGGKLTRTRRSGGPRTPAGKALSARNSLKTGAYSNQIVLPGESQEDYLVLEDYFLKEYKPQTITEGMLVSDITKCVWKKLRLERIETSHFVGRLNQPFSNKEYRLVGLSFPYWVNEDDLNSAHDIEDYDLSEYELLYNATQKWLNEFPTQDEYDAELQKTPLLLARLTRQAEVNGLHPPTPERMYHYKWQVENYQEKRLLPEILREIHEEVGPLVWVLRHKTEVFAAQQRIRDDRTRLIVMGVTLTRQFDHLQNTMFKLIDELSKIQMRRISMALADAGEQPRRIRDKQKV